MQLNFQTNSCVIRANAVLVPDHMKLRLSTGMSWFDEALGTQDKPGFIAGEVILVAGMPGSGKSTLLRQLASMTELNTLMNVVEESFEQVKMALDDKRVEGDFDLSNYRNVDDLLKVVEEARYQVVVVDSLQNLYSETDHLGNELKAAPGSAKQVELCTEKICGYAKRTLCTFFLVGHSTKAGEFRGTATLEHIIDATVKISVDEGTDEDGNQTTTRVLQLEKNRWGMTRVEYYLGMTERGLSLIDAPAQPEKKRSKAGSTATTARQLRADQPDATKHEFMEALIAASGCGHTTAQTYWYSLNRSAI